jgi:hypothetical protein
MIGIIYDRNRLIYIYQKLLACCSC